MVTSCNKCFGEGFVKIPCPNCGPKGDPVFMAPKCFCGKAPVVAVMEGYSLCEFHLKIYTHHKPAFDDERKKYL